MVRFSAALAAVVGLAALSAACSRALTDEKKVEAAVLAALGLAAP